MYPVEINLESCMGVHLRSAISDLIIRRPADQLQHIATWLEFRAMAMEGSERRIDSLNGIKEVEAAIRRVNEIYLAQVAALEAMRDRVIDVILAVPTLALVKLQASNSTSESMAAVVERLASVVPNTDTCYIGRVKEENGGSSIEYIASNRKEMLQQTLPHGKGVSWRLLSSEHPNVLYIEEVVTVRPVHWFLSYPRPGSLLLIKFKAADWPEAPGETLSESTYVLGIDTVGKGVKIDADIITSLVTMSQILSAGIASHAQTRLSELNQQPEPEPVSRET